MKAICEQALLLADREACSLGPLIHHQPTCLLPVGGRPTLAHALDELYEIGVRKVYVAICAFPEVIRAAVGDGERWGMEVHYLPTAGRIQALAALDRLAWNAQEPIWVAEVDRVRGGATAAFAKRLNGAADSKWATGRDGRDKPLGLALYRQDGNGKTKHVLEDASVSMIDTPTGLYQANVDALEGRLQVDAHDCEIVPGLRAGNGVEIENHVQVEGQVLAGARCFFGKDVQLGPRTVLGRRVFVDRGAQVKNSLVLPETYIGENLQLDRVIACSEGILRLDDDTLEEAWTPALLSEVSPRSLGRGFDNFIHRTLALLMVIATLPLWPVLLICSLLRNPRAPFRKVCMPSNRRRGIHRETFGLIEAAAQIPVLRALPGLWAVAEGHLRLVGVNPELLIDREYEAEMPWEDVLSNAPLGFLYPGKWSKNDPLAAELADVLYVQQRSLKKDLLFLARAPFQRQVPCPDGLPLTPR